MPNTQEDTSLISLELTQAQRENYERAASAKNQTFSEWIKYQLDKNAKEDIGQSSAATTLSPESFEEFQEMLEAPRPAATEELLNRKAIWG